MGIPRPRRDRMALKLNGKDDRLTRQDLLMLARTIDLPIARAEAMMSELAMRLGDAAPGVTLPERLGEGAAKTAQNATRDIVAGRIEVFR